MTPLENIFTDVLLNFTANVTMIGETDGSSILLSGVMSAWNEEMGGLPESDAMLFWSLMLPRVNVLNEINGVPAVFTFLLDVKFASGTKPNASADRFAMVGTSKVFNGVNRWCLYTVELIQ